MLTLKPNTVTGSEVAPYDTIRDGIKAVLYSQLEEDQALSACMIIHTCNKGHDKVSFLPYIISYILSIDLLFNPLNNKI